MSLPIGEYNPWTYHQSTEVLEYHCSQGNNCQKHSWVSPRVNPGVNILFKPHEKIISEMPGMLLLAIPISIHIQDPKIPRWAWLSMDHWPMASVQPDQFVPRLEAWRPAQHRPSRWSANPWAQRHQLSEPTIYGISVSLSIYIYQYIVYKYMMGI